MEHGSTSLESWLGELSQVQEALSALYYSELFSCKPTNPYEAISGALIVQLAGIVERGYAFTVQPGESDTSSIGAH